MLGGLDTEPADTSLVPMMAHRITPARLVNAASKANSGNAWGVLSGGGGRMHIDTMLQRAKPPAGFAGKPR